MAYFSGSKGERAITHALLEVTSPEASLTGINSRDWSSDVCSSDLRACAEHTSGNDVTSGHVTSFRSGPLPVTSVTHA